MKKLVFTAIASTLLVQTMSLHAQDTPLDRLRTYLQVDTVNPPGNETRGVAFFSKILDAEGIRYETAESAPGRGNIWARLEGGDEPGLILLHHMDVVPATASEWDTDPLTAVTQDGYVFGRGAVDAKSLGILHLEAFLALHRSGQRPDRDVIFMATADEEAGGLFGAGWLIDNRPEIFENAGYLLNEGGYGLEADGRILFKIELAQKRPFWLRLTATDEPGHGSMPQSTSAPTRLIQALNRIYETPFEPRVVEPVQRMFEAIAAQAGPAWQDELLNIHEAVKDPEFLRRFQADRPDLHALIRNTCSITMLVGSEKINVVPPVASAELDCRILPDQDAQQFLGEIASRVNDEHIRIEEIMLFGAAESSADTELFHLLEDVTKRHYSVTKVIPAVSTGFTDSHFFRDIGITSYGYSPLVIRKDHLAGVHGNNERIGIDTFERGVEMMTEIVSRFVSSHSGE